VATRMGGDDDADGVVIRDFSFVFETMSEFTKAWKKEVKDSRFLKWLLKIGKKRALDLFHLLDKDRGGTLTSREFVFGMKENKALPTNITLDDLWKFARHFDHDGDGTIESTEFSKFIKSLEPIKEPRHPYFECTFPDTFGMSDGQLTSWWAPGGDGMDQFTARSLPARGWEGVADVLRSSWKRLPPQAQYTKRGEVANFAVQWTSERGDDGEIDFRASVLTLSAFQSLSKQPSSMLKSTVAVQAFVWSKMPGVMYKCFYTAGGNGRSASAHTMLYRRLGRSDPSLAASSSIIQREDGEVKCYKKTVSLTPCSNPTSTVGSRVQSMTTKLIRVFERSEGKQVAKCITCFMCDDPTTDKNIISLVACPLFATRDPAPPGESLPPLHAKKNFLGRTSASAHTPLACQGDFCETVPQWLKLSSVDLLSTFSHARTQLGQHLVAVSCIQRARLEMQVFAGGGVAGATEMGMGGAGGTGGGQHVASRGGTGQGSRGGREQRKQSRPALSDEAEEASAVGTQTVVKTVLVGRALESGRLLQVDLRVVSQGTVARSGVTLWMTLRGHTSSRLLLSVVCPSGE
jgi:hypothetical protein